MGVNTPVNFDVVRNLDNSPLDEDIGPYDETKAEGGWILGWGLVDGKIVKEPEDQRIEGIDNEPVVCAAIIDEDFEKAEPNEMAKLFATQSAPIITKSTEQWERREEKYMLQLVLDFEKNDWEEIASLIGKPVRECIEKYRELADLPLPDCPPVAWSVKEDAELLRWVDEYQVKDWVRISHFLQHDVDGCQQRYKKLTTSPKDATVPLVVGGDISTSSHSHHTRSRKRKHKVSTNDEQNASNEGPPLKVARMGLPTPCFSDGDSADDVHKFRRKAPEAALSTARKNHALAVKLWTPLSCSGSFVNSKDDKPR